MYFILNAILIIFLILIITVIHELGHFLLARFFNVKVKTFACGIGPNLFSYRDQSGVLWKFGLLPLAGYVEFDDKPDAHSVVIDTLHPMKKFLIAFAGPLVNILSTIIIFQILYLLSYQSENGFTLTYQYIGKIISKIFSTNITNDLKSPVALFSDANCIGFKKSLDFIAKISINVGIMNLIPFLFVLDGGHMVIYLYEAVIGLKSKSRKIIEYTARIQMYMLYILSGCIIIRDILNKFR